MLPLIIGVAMTATPQLHPNHHVATVRVPSGDLERGTPLTLGPERALGHELQIDDQRVWRAMQLANIVIALWFLALSTF